MTAAFPRPHIPPPSTRRHRLVRAAERTRTFNDLSRLHQAIGVSGLSGDMAIAMVDAERALLEAWGVR